MMHFLCFQSKSFIDTSIIYFGLNLGFVIPREVFGKDNFHGGIKLDFPSLIWKIYMVLVFFVISPVLRAWLGHW